MYQQILLQDHMANQSKCYPSAHQCTSISVQSGWWDVSPLNFQVTQKWKIVSLTVIFKEILNWRHSYICCIFFKLSSGVEKTVNIYHLITWISMVFIFSCQLNIKWLISCWDIILSVLTCNDDILFVIVLFQEKNRLNFTVILLMTDAWNHV